jgi:predicted outer membrane protein
MDRRTVLAGLALAASPILVRAAGAQAAAASIGEAETKYIKDTTAIGSMSLAASRAADRKARNRRVREFAGLETDEQNTVADVMKSLGNPGTVSGKIVPPTDDELMGMLDPASKAALSSLEALRGAKFDAAYVAAEIDGHQKLLKVQEAYRDAGGVLPAIVAAKFLTFAINEHLTLLADIKDRLKG